MIDYKPVFDKYIERLFAFDTQDAKLTISYNSHYPDPKKLEYEKAYTYLLGEFKRIEALHCYDYEYSYNMIQDQLVNFIVFIDEYKRAYEYGQAEYDFYAEFWHDKDIKLLENSIVDFKNRVEKYQQQNSKPVENKEINNMDNKLFDNLHIYSLNIQNIPINETTIEKIIYLNDELFEDEFKIADNYLLQKAIIDSKDSAVDLVLKNLNKAINTNCGNTIDFSDIQFNHYYGLNYSDVTGQSSIKKKYKNISYTPDNFELFRKIWLYNYIEEIKQVREAIYTIIGKPLIEPTKIVSEPNKNDIEIEMYAYNLGHCISTATRWDMKAIKKTITENTPYSVFTSYFNRYHELFNNFKKALRIEFDNPQNGKGFEIDMINRFSNMIKLYYNWYEEHNEETKIFDPYNPYEYIYGFVKEAELELKKYFKFEITKTNSNDVFAIIKVYEDFSESTKIKVNALFDSNVDKTQKLDTYFKEIFPEYISETNNLLSTLQEMENSFKSTISVLTDDHNKPVSINAKFKTQIFESIEKMFYKISEIDSNRFYSEYFEAINFLETRLELNNKQIAPFFKTLEKRLKQLKVNTISSSIAHTDKKIISKITPAIDRTINESEFETYFKPTFKGVGEYKINHFANLVEDLRLNRTPRVFAQIALLIYESKQLNSRKPTYFSEWYKIFCVSVGCERKKYEPKDLRPISKNVMSLFSYLLD